MTTERTATTAASPTASLVRTEILAQHAGLRAFLTEAARAAAAAARGDTGAGRSMFSVCTQLRKRLERHMAFEEGVLVPALQQSDPSGAERARQLENEHVRQRQELSMLVAVGQTEVDPRTVAFTLQTLISDILIDMAHEERELLGPDVLHDDPIVVDQITG